MVGKTHGTVPVWRQNRNLLQDPLTLKGYVNLCPVLTAILWALCSASDICWSGGAEQL